MKLCLLLLYVFCGLSEGNGGNKYREDSWDLEDLNLIGM